MSLRRRIACLFSVVTWWADEHLGSAGKWCPHTIFPRRMIMNAPRQNLSFSILINSSDGFEDCWQPFFTLFGRYWPNCDVPILLNTELKDWAFPGLQIQCTQVQRRSRGTKRLTWSECLAEALSQVKTPLVLYLQEDYFIERPVNFGLIDEFVELMAANSEIKHIGLTHFGSIGPFESTDDMRLISLFAAISSTNSSINPKLTGRSMK